MSACTRRSAATDLLDNLDAGTAASAQEAEPVAPHAADPAAGLPQVIPAGAGNAPLWGAIMQSA